jgi:hypothetical protein
MVAGTALSQYLRHYLRAYMHTLLRGNRQILLRASDIFGGHRPLVLSSTDGDWRVLATVL